MAENADLEPPKTNTKHENVEFIGRMELRFTNSSWLVLFT